MADETKWSVDPAHSEIAFKIRHLMIANVKGKFKIFDASIYTSSNDFKTAVIDLWIDASSITTGDEGRDQHLRGSEFFDTENHKQITFTSNTIGVPDSTGNHELWGELTIKGITKNLKLNVQFGGIVIDPWGNQKAGFTINGKIKRSDWGLVWNTILETGGVMLGDEVIISCELELIDAGKRDLTIRLKPTLIEKDVQ